MIFPDHFGRKILPGAGSRKFARLSRVSFVTLTALAATLLLTALDSGGTTARAAGRTPVIVIPGVAGSTFKTGPSYTFYTDNNGHGGTYRHTYGANETVWVNAWEAALSGDDDYFDTLRLQPDGDTPYVPYSHLFVEGIYTDAYGDLLDFLRRQGYVDNVTLFAFPFDWRRDIYNATYANLDALVNRARAAAGTTQVDLVGHSMGGLVGRNYIASSPATASKVRRLITLGTPFLGSPKFLKTLLYGDQFGPTFLGLGLNPEEVKDITQNLGGGWQLLPSRSYHSFYNNSSAALLAPYREDRDVDRDGRVSGVLDYSGLQAFLRNLGKNQNTAALAQAFHDRLDSYWPSEPKVTFINGGGIATLGQIRDYTGSCWNWFRYVPCPKTDLLNIDGDGTVPYYSATPYDPGRGLDLFGNATAYIVNREHAALVQYDRILGIYSGDGPSLYVLGQILNNQLDPIGGAALSTGLDSLLDRQTGRAKDRAASVKRSGSRLAGYAISVTNDAQIEVIDGKGQRTGRAKNTEKEKSHKYELGITGSAVDKADGTEFIFVPEGGPYTLRVNATETGSFDLKIRQMEGDQIKQTALFLNVPVTAGEQAELTFKGFKEALPRLRVGGQSTARTLEASAVLDQTASLDQQGPVISLAAPSVSDRVARLDWQARDGLSGLLLEQGVLDPGGAEQTVQRGATMRLTPGNHTLQVLAQDRAGNTSLKEVRFVVP